MEPDTSPNPSELHLGWHDRGRLPHRDADGIIQTVTFRLADSLPQRVLDLWARELKGEDRTEADRERRRRIEEYLDAGHGICSLRDPHLASMVQEALLYFDNDRYRLRAWCVMPNHVHVMMDVWTGHPLHKVVWSWKSWTAKQANARLGRAGAFWHREYYDRFIRDTVHLHNAIAYIEHNPVKARFVAAPADWPWSSANR